MLRFSILIAFVSVPVLFLTSICLDEPLYEKNSFLHMQIQRRRSASR